MRTLLWFRGKDLRLSDHAPLQNALFLGEIVPLFVLDPYFFAPKQAKEFPHRIQYLLDSLRVLSKNIEKKGSKLLLVKGKSVDVIPSLAKRWKVDRVVAHRWVEPFGQKRDQIISEKLDVPFVLYEGETLLPPGTLRSGTKKPYAVFTPFAKAFYKSLSLGTPLTAPKTFSPLPKNIQAKSQEIPDCKSLGIQKNSKILSGGEDAAQKRLKIFLRNNAAHYHQNRNRMDLAATSRLSADIKFGTLSILSVWSSIDKNVPDGNAKKTFLNELIWREFTYSTLYDKPQILSKPFRKEFDNFPWKFSKKYWNAWSNGKTGYPVVDAAARQLLQEGFVHNRARMIAASFLTKHLNISYQYGEAHYMKYLTDGDWAQNNAGWQWSAGCGCDAQPYFRVFNPISQGKKFDPEGNYVRRWIPELSQLPDKYIHEPWNAPELILQQSDVALGHTYPTPVVEHKKARETFLETAKNFLQKNR